MFGKMLTTRVAASYTGCSEGYLEKLRVIGGGPEFVKLGKAVRYEQEALDCWLASRRRRSTSHDGQVAHIQPVIGSPGVVRKVSLGNPANPAPIDWVINELEERGVKLHPLNIAVAVACIGLSPEAARGIVGLVEKRLQEEVA
jgi:hypothetical protein